MSAEFQGAAFSPASPAHPEQWELFELLTEGTTELNAHVKAHVATGCPSCGKHLADIRTLSKAREMKEEFDAFFDELPQDDAPADEREEFLLKFKTKKRPSDRLGRLAHDGRQFAAEIVKAVSEEGAGGLDKAKELLGKIEADPSRGYAYLYACQLAMPKVPTDPAKFLGFAKVVAEFTKCLPFLRDKGPAQPVCREQILGESALVESSALNFLGRAEEAQSSASAARIHFLSAGEDSFALALVDFFEGSAATFAGHFPVAWKLLKGARSEFQLYGQENWQGRAEAAIGVLLFGKEKYQSALHFYDGAVKLLHPELDGAAYTTTLINRGFCLVRVGRLEAAKAAYARCIGHARRLGMSAHLLMIRSGLATIELLKGNTTRALRSFERVSADATEQGLEQFVLCAQLRIAECLSKLGRSDEVAQRVSAIRNSVFSESISSNPAYRELCETISNQAASPGLIAHIADYFEGRNRGVRTPYKPFRLAASGY